MRRAWMTFFVLGVIVAGLRTIDVVAAAIARNDSRVEGAEWIWASGSELGQVVPQAFLAIRGFELERIPAQASVWIAADEEYVLTLNGNVVGAGSKQTPMVLDGYRVEDLLEPGNNRIAVELRSSRGAGGLLVSLESPRVGSLVVSDRSWRIFRRYDVGVAHGGASLDDGELPWSWGRPRVGRWGLPERGGPKLRWDRLIGRKSRLSGWVVGEPGMSRKQRQELAKGPIVSFDFGRSVSAFIRIGQTGNRALRALLYTGEDRLPDLRGEQEPTGYVISIPGSRSWQDSIARRFRYVTLVGIDQRIRLRALQVDPSLVAVERRDDLAKVGVLGIQPPQLRSPMKNEIWRKLESGKSSP